MVNAEPARITMAHHADACADALLGHVEQRALEANTAAIDAFEAAEGRVTRVAGSTEECLQIAREIGAAQAELDDLKGALAKSRLADRFLEAHRCVLCVRHCRNVVML